MFPARRDKFAGHRRQKNMAAACGRGHVIRFSFIGNSNANYQLALTMGSTFHMLSLPQAILSTPICRPARVSV